MRYRAEIDGLRAIAVLSVLSFHFGFVPFSGGYVGVDIFFVISGYLISLILLSDISNDTFKLKTFYDRRIRRLFPALLAMMALSFVFAHYLFMPDEFEEFAQSVVASTLYVSNIFFWLKSDYFAGPSELKPLLHTWSLAVEEQFYLIFPLVLMLSVKYLRAYTFYILSALLLLSFIAGVLTLNVDSSAAFFLLPTRIWELLLGSLLAYWHFSGRVTHGKYSSYIGAIGLLMILVSVLYYDKSTAFPGINALLPVVGTAMVLADQSGKGWLVRLLCSAPLVFVGKISYSLYLWHWPVLVFYGYWLIRPFENADKLIMLFMSLGLSLISYYMLEKPFRKPVKTFSFAKSLGVSALFSIIFVSLGLYVSHEEGLPHRAPFALVSTDSLITNHTELSNYHAKLHRQLETSCFLKAEQKFEYWVPEDCKIKGSDSAHTSLLWGDSHANHLIVGLTSIRSELKHDLYIFSNAGCPPILDLQIAGRPNCAANNAGMFESLKRLNIKRVYLAASWHYAIEQSGMSIDELRDTITSIQSKGVEVILINQLPIYSIASPEYLLARLANADALDKDYLLKPARGLNLAKKLQRAFPNVQIVDLHRAFCNTEGRCAIYKNGKLTVVDQAHLSIPGSSIAAEFLLPHLNVCHI